MRSLRSTSPKARQFVGTWGLEEGVEEQRVGLG